MDAEQCKQQTISVADVLDTVLRLLQSRMLE